jgi:hypothetical protein
MEDRDAVAFENLCKWTQINRERIHEHKVAWPRDLHKRQFREIGALTMELRIERITRLISEKFDDPSKLCVGGDYSELWISHLCSSDRRIAENNSTSAVDPTVGSAGDVDRIDSLAPEEFCSAGASATDGTNHINRPRRRNLRKSLRNSRQRDVESTRNMAIGIFIVLANIDEDCSRCEHAFKFTEIDFWD